MNGLSVTIFINRIDNIIAIIIFVTELVKIKNINHTLNPTCSNTPLGREICDAMLAVPRAFHRADYLPCILWGRIAQEVSQCHTRDVISINGRLQSRVYTKVTENGTQERTAYEISALTAEVIEENLY